MHPEIACGWESAGRHYFRRRVTVMERVLRADFRDLRSRERAFYESNGASHAKALGFRLLFRCHPRWWASPGWSLLSQAEALRACLRWLRQNPDVHIIHLVRRDNIEWLRSLELARITGLYAGAPYPEDLRVSIPVGPALRRVRMKHYLGDQLAVLAATHAYSRVTYESFREQPAEVIERLHRFLGIEPVGLQYRQPKLRIQSGRGNEVYNEAQVRAALEQAGMALDVTGRVQAAAQQRVLHPK